MLLARAPHVPFCVRVGALVAGMSSSTCSSSSRMSLCALNLQRRPRPRDVLLRCVARPVFARCAVYWLLATLLSPPGFCTPSSSTLSAPQVRWLALPSDAAAICMQLLLPAVRLCACAQACLSVSCPLGGARAGMQWLTGGRRCTTCAPKCACVRCIRACVFGNARPPVLRPCSDAQHCASVRKRTGYSGAGAAAVRPQLLHRAVAVRAAAGPCSAVPVVFPHRWPGQGAA